MTADEAAAEEGGRGGLAKERCQRRDDALCGWTLDPPHFSDHTQKV